MTFATPGWVSTFLLLIFFGVGSYFAYEQISDSRRTADYQACVERVAMVSETTTDYQLSVRACDYLRDGKTVIRGRYSSVAGSPHRLAMTTRPVF